MTRILVVARTEFLALVRTKAFIIGILMVPVLIAATVPPSVRVEPPKLIESLPPVAFAKAVTPMF